MKKTTIFILSIVLLLSLAGCHSVTPSGSSSGFTSPSSVSLTSSKAQTALSQTGSVFAASSEEVFSIPSTIGTPIDHITYLHDFDFYPVSHMKEGTQLLSGNLEWCFTVSEYIGRTPSVENLKRHYIKDMYDNSGKILFDESEYSLSDIFFCSNGDWDFFPMKVRYEKYTLQNQPDKPAWDEYYMSRIKEVSDVTPLIYTNAYFFDWNGDGIEDALVYACNTFDSNEECAPNPPYYDKTATYDLSVLFLSGNAPYEIDGYVTDYVTKKPRDDNIHNSYIKSNDYSEHQKSAIQYDSEGNLMVCPIFINDEGFGDGEDIVIMSDIDGDRKTEIIIIKTPAEYSFITIDKLINKKPVEVFRMFEGA